MTRVPGVPLAAATTPFADRSVLVAGAGVSGAAAARALLAEGARVAVTDASGDRLAALDLDGVQLLEGLEEPPGGTELVVTSPGWRPDAPLLLAARERGVEVIGEVELAWRLDRASGRPAVWLGVTGTNGKTTTVGMLAEMLRAAGLDAAACGNVGLPVVDAVHAGHLVLAVELSSFQLHWANTLEPHAGAVLNVAEDHLDWHGSLPEYAAAKGRIHAGRTLAVFNVDDEWSARLAAERPRRVGFTLGEPAHGQLGVSARDGGCLLDRAFTGLAGPATGTSSGDAAPAFGQPVEPAQDGADTVLAAVSEVHPDGPHNRANAVAAAALARSAGVDAAAVSAGLRAFHPGEHRAVPIAETAGVRWVDDSKATNPHAAAASLHAHPRVVWIAGGLLKGATVDELVADVSGRLDGAVLIGRDRGVIADALSRHAPGVPVHEVPEGDHDPMVRAVRQASELAHPGAAVVLAPAAASMDMFVDYVDRGRAFAEAVHAVLAERAETSRGG